jgi:hypothetical protein
MYKYAGYGLLILAVSGCAIKQEVKVADAISTVEKREVCVIQKSAVRAGFLEAYKAALTDKNYLVKTLPETSTIKDCPVVSTYNAQWRWDLALYMAYAEIKVFKDGEKVGSALYDSRSGGGNMGKFIDAEKKIKELTEQVFP